MIEPTPKFPLAAPFELDDMTADKLAAAAARRADEIYDGLCQPGMSEDDKHDLWYRARYLTACVKMQLEGTNPIAPASARAGLAHVADLMVMFRPNSQVCDEMEKDREQNDGFSDTSIRAGVELLVDAVNLKCQPLKQDEGLVLADDLLAGVFKDAVKGFSDMVLENGFRGADFAYFKYKISAANKTNQVAVPEQD